MYSDNPYEAPQTIEPKESMEIPPHNFAQIKSIVGISLPLIACFGIALTINLFHALLQGIGWYYPESWKWLALVVACDIGIIALGLDLLKRIVDFRKKSPSPRQR